MNAPTVLYRYDYEFTGDENDWGIRVRLFEFPVIRATAAGTWIRTHEYDSFLRDYKPRFVLNDARKRYACPTEEEAKISFIARKRRQLQILTAQSNNVREALRLIGAEPDLLREKPTDGRRSDFLTFDRDQNTVSPAQPAVGCPDQPDHPEQLPVPG